VIFAKELNKRVENQGVKVVSLHPGVVRTELARYMLNSWIKRLGFLVISPLWYFFTKSVWYGTQTSLYCALLEHEKLVGGAYYGDCKVSSRISPEVSKEELGGKLWAATEKMIKMKF